jgi:hypothetical protein
MVSTVADATPLPKTPKRKKPLGFQGDVRNVDLALTRFCAGRTQVFLSGYNCLERLRNFVAGGHYRRSLPDLRCVV